MARPIKYSHIPRRKREGKTNYNSRLSLLKSGMSRMVVRKSSKGIVCQIINYDPDGDKIVASAHSKELKKIGWKLDCKNISAAYLTGLMLGKKAAKNKISMAVLDIGVQTSTKGSRIYAAAKGAVDAGLKMPLSPEIAPNEDRIRGRHVEEYAKLLKKDQKTYEKIFSGYLKEGMDPTQCTKYFDAIKKKIAEV
ncbi:MAG TPA: 50S ribosomal protein L18 [Candidatus Nanoarchaeia archaeon]|nr:50S ribosomal protein L18 [Candidatus Nanoarchaeia archaeon]